MNIELDSPDEDLKDVIRFLLLTRDLGASIDQISDGLFINREKVRSAVYYLTQYGVEVNRAHYVYLYEDENNELEDYVWKDGKGRDISGLIPSAEDVIQSPYDLFESPFLYDKLTGHLKKMGKTDKEIEEYLNKKVIEEREEFREAGDYLIERYESKEAFKDRVFGNLCCRLNVKYLEYHPKLLGCFLNDLREGEGIAYLILCQEAYDEAIDRICDFTKKRYLKSHHKSEGPIWEKLTGSRYADDVPDDFDADTLHECVLVKAEYEDGAAFFGIHELRKTEFDVSYRNLSVPGTVLPYDVLCATQNLEMSRIRHENAKKVTYVKFLLRDNEVQPADWCMYDIVEMNGEKSLEDIHIEYIPKRRMIWIPETLLGCNNFVINNDFIEWDYREMIDGLSLPEGLKEIGERAFCSCFKIKGSVIFPSTLLRVCRMAFSACVKKAVFLNPETEIDRINFKSDTEVCGYKASSAYYFAKERGLKFTEIE